MKKSKKVMMLKRFGHCVSCKYSHFEFYDFINIAEIGFCTRHNDLYCCAFDPACPHYVPFNDVMPPHKFPYYWVKLQDHSDDDNYIPFRGCFYEYNYS